MSKETAFNKLLTNIGLKDQIFDREVKQEWDASQEKLVGEYLDMFIEYNKKFTEFENRVKNIKGVKSKKKNLIGRRPNFPEYISENIVKIFFWYKYGKILTDSGNVDLTMQLRDKKLRIEVKAFSSTGPTSFGDKECWDLLYFVDATDFINKKFRIYEIHASDDSKEFGSLIVRAGKTYEMARAEAKIKKSNNFRPRWQFSKICEHLNEKTQIVYDGTLSGIQGSGNTTGDKLDDGNADRVSG